jgi:hypothetical protein
MEFRGSITPPARPLSTLRCALTERQRMTRGHRDSLRLRCRAFSSPSPCRFIPALSPAVHPHLSALAALTAPDQHGAAGAVEVALLEPPTPLITATISSIVGGSAGYCSPVFVVGGLGGNRAWSRVHDGGWRHLAARIRESSLRGTVQHNTLVVMIAPRPRHSSTPNAVA